MLDANARNELEKLIHDQIGKTREKIEELRELTRPISPENAIGRVSRMDAINNKSINDAAMVKAKDKLKNLELALSRINLPEFGTCLKCSHPIQQGRILLMPGSPYCVRCASR